MGVREDPRPSQSRPHSVGGGRWVRARGLGSELEVKSKSSSATHPGSRKAGLSRTARVTIGSFGTSKATGPSLSRGSLHKGSQGVSRRPSHQHCRNPSPSSPTHLGTCQTILTWETTVTRSALEGSGRTGSELERPLTQSHRAPRRASGEQSHQPTNHHFYGGQDSERLTSQACPGEQLRLLRAILVGGRVAQISRFPVPAPVSGEERNLILRPQDLARTQSRKDSFPIQDAAHGKCGLPAHSLSLQGDRRAQHHRALHGLLVCLLHQQDQGLLGGQQGPENHTKEKRGESSWGAGWSLA